MKVFALAMLCLLLVGCAPTQAPLPEPTPLSSLMGLTVRAELDRPIGEDSWTGQVEGELLGADEHWVVIKRADAKRVAIRRDAVRFIEETAPAESK